MIAKVGGMLPNPPLTVDQVALMRRDNVAAPDLPGLRDLGVDPTSVESVLDQML
jgi:NADH dehydrogenase